MNMSFNYNIDVDTETRIVLAKIYGIWKEETAREYHEEYKESVQPLLESKVKWAKITNLSNWKSSYPEIIAVLGEHMHWCVDNGAEYSVYIIENPVTERQLKAMIENSQVGTSTLTFNSQREAEKFLESKGYV